MIREILLASSIALWGYNCATPRPAPAPAQQPAPTQTEEPASIADARQRVRTLEAQLAAARGQVADLELAPARNLLRWLSWLAIAVAALGAVAALVLPAGKRWGILGMLGGGVLFGFTQAAGIALAWATAIGWAFLVLIVAGGGIALLIWRRDRLVAHQAVRVAEALKESSSLPREERKKLQREIVGTDSYAVDGVRRRLGIA